MSRRDMSRYSQYPTHQFGSIAEFMSGPVPEGLLTIGYNGSPLDILNQPTGAKTTIVTFHTALSPKMLTTPVFSGAGLTEGLDLNLVFISDPTLEHDDSLKLSWFAGNKQQRLQRDLPAVLRHIIDSQGADNVIFFGASGGGFAALYYSSFFPGSLAIPLNPQIVIKDFPEESVVAYTKVAFDAPSIEAARRVLADEVTGDLRHVYRGGHTNTVAYVQNTMDTHHLYRHLTHFLRATPQTPAINLFMADWGRGHVPPPKDFLAKMMKEIAATAPDWNSALGTLGFKTAPTAEYAVEMREGSDSQ